MTSVVGLHLEVMTLKRNGHQSNFCGSSFSLIQYRTILWGLSDVCPYMVTTDLIEVDKKKLHEYIDMKATTCVTSSYVFVIESCKESVSLKQTKCSE